MAITFVTVAPTVYSGGTSLTMTYPTGLAVGEIVVLIIGMKPSTANSGSVTTPAGWTAVPNGALTGAGGYGTTLGADTGNTNVFTFSRVVTGALTGNFTVTLANNNVAWANILEFRNDTLAWEIAGATGQDTTAGNVSIATTPTLAMRPGDDLIGAMVIPTDVTTPTQFSAQAFTATGATFGTITELAEPDSITGNDIGGFICFGEVATGTVTSAVTLTATAGGTTTNVRGPGVVIRLREVIGPVQNLQATGFTDADSFAAATVTRLGPVQTLTTTSVFANQQTFGASTVRRQALRFLEASAVTYHTGTTATITIPSAIVNGDVVLVIFGEKPNIDFGGGIGIQFPLIENVTGNFALVDSNLSLGDSSVAPGADVGAVGYAVFMRRATGLEGGTTTQFAMQNIDIAWAQVVTYRAGTDVDLLIATDVHDQTTTPGTTLSAPFTGTGAFFEEFLYRGSDTAWVSYDTVTGTTVGAQFLWGMTIPTDVTTPAQFSNYVYTNTSGITLSPIVELSEPDTSTNFDLGGFLARAEVTQGVGTAVGTLAVDVAGTRTNVKGPVFQLRLLTIRAIAWEALALEGQNTFGALTVTREGGTFDIRSAFFSVF